MHDDVDSDLGVGTRSLVALQQIHTVGDVPPFRIVPIVVHHGSTVSPHEIMEAKVKWADRVRWRVISLDVPPEFAPYNAIIRVLGTEDYHADYLATLRESREESRIQRVPGARQAHGHGVTHSRL